MVAPHEAGAHSRPGSARTARGPVRTVELAGEAGWQVDVRHERPHLAGCGGHVAPPLPWSVHPRSASPASRPDRSGAPLTALDQRAGAGHRAIPGLRPHPAGPHGRGRPAPGRGHRAPRADWPGAPACGLSGRSGRTLRSREVALGRPELSPRADRLVRRPAGCVGISEHDQRAGTDAFDVLDLIVERRLSPAPHRHRHPGARSRPTPAYRDLARRHQMAAYAVVFETPADVCQARNRGRARTVPSKVLTAQLPRDRDAALVDLPAEGFDGVHAPEPVEIVPPPCSAPAAAAAAAARLPCASGCTCPRSPTRRGGRSLRRPSGRSGRHRGSGRLLQSLGDGPRGADPPGRSPVGRHPGELDNRRLAGRPHQHDPHRDPCHGRHSAQPGSSGQDRRHHRRAQRRPGPLRARTGLVGVGTPALRLALPVHRGSLCPPRGHPATAARDVGPGIAAVPGRCSRSPRRSATPSPAGARPDPGWGIGGKDDPAAGRPPRRRLQPVRRPDDSRAQAVNTGAPLRGGRTGPRRGADHPPVHGGRGGEPREVNATVDRLQAGGARPGAGRGATRAPAPSTIRSAATAIWPRPGWRRRSWPCPTWPRQGPSSRSAT